MSDFSEDNHVMDDDDLDVSNLSKSAINFSYENNANMEIGTMRNAIDLEDNKGNLNLIEDNILVVQSHWEVIGIVFKKKHCFYKKAQSELYLRTQ
jgi:predicted Rossmann fold nucleotide-binding protein DprA/Smf involved in DNA uptake